MRVSGISTVYTLPGICGKVAGEQPADGRRASLTAFSFCQLQAFTTQRPGVEQVTQTEVSRLLYTRWRAAEFAKCFAYEGFLVCGKALPSSKADYIAVKTVSTAIAVNFNIEGEGGENVAKT